MKNLVLTTLTLAALASASYACDTCKKDTVFGKPVPLGNGMVFSYARLDKKSKKPISIGVTFTESAFSGLPEAAALDPKMPSMEMVLELPEEIKGKPYDHISLEWNPVGHEPAKIYDVAHFDVHFYTIARSDRSRIRTTGPDLAVTRKAVPAGFMAAGYINPPNTDVPMMGTHWIDPKSPEFNGSPFTSTFLYGSYAGKMVFVEPMVTMSFLQSKPQFSQAISSPMKVTRSGYYPTKYGITYSEARKETSISLDGLVFRQADNPKIAKASKR